MEKKSGFSKFLTAIGAIVATLAAAAAAFAIFKKFFKKKDKDAEFVFTESFDDDEEVIVEE